MIRYQSLKQLFERKSYSELYHFTNVQKMMSILKENTLEGFLTSGLGYKTISLTRNFNLKDIIHRNISWGAVRLIIDGEKLSDKYKIMPFYDLLNIEDPILAKNKKYTESEEVVIADKIYPIMKYIKQIDINSSEISSYEKQDIIDFTEKNVNKNVYTYKNIKLQFVDKFKSYKYQKIR